MGETYHSPNDIDPRVVLSSMNLQEVGRQLKTAVDIENLGTLFCEAFGEYHQLELGHQNKTNLINIVRGKLSLLKAGTAQVSVHTTVSIVNTFVSARSTIFNHKMSEKKHDRYNALSIKVCESYQAFVASAWINRSFVNTTVASLPYLDPSDLLAGYEAGMLPFPETYLGAYSFELSQPHRRMSYYSCGITSYTLQQEMNCCSPTWNMTRLAPLLAEVELDYPNYHTWRSHLIKSCPNDFVSMTPEFLDELQEWDVVEVDRGVYSHFVVVVEIYDLDKTPDPHSGLKRRCPDSSSTDKALKKGCIQVQQSNIRRIVKVTNRNVSGLYERRNIISIVGSSKVRKNDMIPDELSRKYRKSSASCCAERLRNVEGSTDSYSIHSTPCCGFCTWIITGHAFSLQTTLCLLDRDVKRLIQKLDNILKLFSS